MASWSTTTKHEPTEINGGQKYELGDQVSLEQLNAITENTFNTANKDLSNITIEVAKTKTIYDMSSNDSAINWGYTSGIQGGVIVSGKDFSEYKRLVVSVNCAYTSFSYIISLENANTILPNDLAGYSYGGSAQGQSASSHLHTGISTTFVSTDKTKIYHKYIGRYYISATRDYEESDNSNLYCITHIEGVY